MHLKILKVSPSRKYPFYRGTDREEPYYQNNLPLDHPVNRAFLWYVGHDPDTWKRNDLVELKTMITLYKQLTPPQYFELIEITDVLETAQYGTTLLGLDISNQKRLSYLSSGLDVMIDALADDQGVKPLIPLIKLVSFFFKPKLNECGLFDDSEVASFFLNCIQALLSIKPTLWDNDVYLPVLVWQVESYVRSNSETV